MSYHVHVDYGPPRSWEQFEELCADIFQSAWRDPGLVRHGRAGQRQYGVDIVAQNGGLYPVGLQCKKRSKWPVSKLTAAQIDGEVSEALNFRPALKAFYILTTAPEDAALLAHVRKINEQHKKKKWFQVVLLGWGEIVRRATLDPHVADKHFSPSGGGAPRSPLLATWMLSGGKLEKTAVELELSVTELSQDLRSWPTGHIVIRQRETDNLLEALRKFEGINMSEKKRRERIELRDRLRALTDVERDAQRGVMFMLTDADASVWFTTIWKEDTPAAIEAYINGLGHSFDGSSSGSQLRMSPPGNPKVRCAASLSAKDGASIMSKMQEHQDRYSKPMSEMVSELPSEVRSRIAIPRIVNGIFEFLSEDRLTWEQIRQMSALDIGLWRFSLA